MSRGHKHRNKNNNNQQFGGSALTRALLNDSKAKNHADRFGEGFVHLVMAVELATGKSNEDERPTFEADLVESLYSSYAALYQVVNQVTVIMDEGDEILLTEGLT